jgi:hypothetical protein
MRQLGSHWTDLHEIWCLWTFRKSFEKIRVSLKSVKNKLCFTWRALYMFFISLSFLHKMRNVSDKSVEKIQVFLTLKTVRPIYRTGVPLHSRCYILYILSINISNDYFNLEESCVLYTGRAYRYTPDVAFYIFFQKI